MATITRAFALPIIAIATLTLAACGPNANPDAPAPDAGSSLDAPADPMPTVDTGDGEPGEACPPVPQEGYELFSSSIVVDAPPNGAIYGDGTPISWTMESAPEDAQFDVELSYVSTDGDAIPMSGFFLDDLGDNVWGANFNVYTSDAHERPAFATLGVTSDTVLTDSGEITGTHQVLGVYCLSIRVSE